MGAGATVLIVDDEEPLRRLVRPYLEAEGFSVAEAADGPSALDALRHRSVALAIVDVMLPGYDGFQLLRRIREFSDLPVLMLTARRDEGYRVAGLRQGADDYVVKPFSVPELVARVVAHLRRAQPDSSGEVLQVGEVAIDTASRTVSMSESEVVLTRREFDLLVALASNPGRVLSRDALLRLAWDTDHFTAKTVDVHLASLRRKLQGNLDVSTVRGVGYRLDSR
jgi:DNA-binding response OmpR family regulator